jgi:hypothetical protein
MIAKRTERRPVQTRMLLAREQEQTPAPVASESSTTGAEWKRVPFWNPVASA